MHKELEIVRTLPGRCETEELLGELADEIVQDLDLTTAMELRSARRIATAQLLADAVSRKALSCVATDWNTSGAGWLLTVAAYAQKLYSTEVKVIADIRRVKAAVETQAEKFAIEAKNVSVDSEDGVRKIGPAGE